jgi:hypothetical protein
MTRIFGKYIKFSKFFCVKLHQENYRDRRKKVGTVHRHCLSICIVHRIIHHRYCSAPATVASWRASVHGHLHCRPNTVHPPNCSPVLFITGTLFSTVPVADCLRVAFCLAKNSIWTVPYEVGLLTGLENSQLLYIIMRGTVLVTDDRKLSSSCRTGGASSGESDPAPLGTTNWSAIDIISSSGD